MIFKDIPSSPAPGSSSGVARRSGPVGASQRLVRQRGFALLIVLWSMALLALIGTRITAAGRGETRLATNLRASAVAEAAADAAVYEALFHLMDGSSAHWPADGRARALRLPQAQADVTLVDENRKISLNNSALPLLHGLLRAVGVDPRLAVVLTDQIADWRSPTQVPLRQGAKAPQYHAAGRDWGPPDQPFRSVDELGLVLSMTPDILARLRPYMSPYVESSPKVDEPDPVIAAALADAAANGAPPLSFDEPPVVTITAVAVGAGGGRFTRRAVVRLNTDLASNPGQPQFFVLDWDQGTD
jgi:general secretion pathway protein K